MVCKKCGYEIQKGWKYCPNCRLKIKAIGIIPAVAIIIIILIIVFGGSIIYELIRPVDKNYVKKQLENKYNEEFETVEFVEKIENEDRTIGCDGSTAILSGRGETEYYKFYSDENQLEFFAVYDNSNGFRIIEDTYGQTLRRKETLEYIYNNLDANFQKNITEISIRNSLNDELVKISSFRDLEKQFEKYDIKDAKKMVSVFFDFEDDMYVYIENNNINVIDFYNQNEESLRDLKNTVRRGNAKASYNINLEIILNDNYKINFRDDTINVKTGLSDYMPIDEYIKENKNI